MVGRLLHGWLSEVYRPSKSWDSRNKMGSDVRYRHEVVTQTRPNAATTFPVWRGEVNKGRTAPITTKLTTKLAHGEHMRIGMHMQARGQAGR